MPVQYTSVLLGSGTQLSDLSIYQPQEESTPEGSLILLELDLAESIDQSTVDGINTACAGVGITPWPGNTVIASLDGTGTVLSLMWLKGIAWLPAILGVLALTILPVLLGVFLWWLIPEEVQNMIEAVVMMMVMMVMMRMMMPMFATEEKPKQVEGAER